MEPDAQHSSPNSQRTGLSPLQSVLLIIILLAGAALRLYRIDWDNGTLPHPDERSTVAFYAPSIRWPADLSTALDARRSPLNPFWDVVTNERRSYTYGHFPLYTLVLTAELAHLLAPAAEAVGLPAPIVRTMVQARSANGYANIGRFLVALCDVATIYLVFLLGRRLYGSWAGLLAAAFSAFTVLQIQLAHFFAVDPISTTFTLLALYGAIRMVDRGERGAALLTGVGIGLAVASKFSALPVVVAPLVATLLAGRRPAADRTVSDSRLWGNLLLAGWVSLVVFAITSPYVFLDFGSFWQAVVKEQGDMVSGVADLPFTRQYRGTPAYVYFLEQQLWWGMGLPLGLLAYAGLAWVLVRAVLRRLSLAEWVVLSWVLLYFGVTGLFLAKFMRYMVPVVPLFVLFGAGLVSNLGRLSDLPSRLGRYVGSALRFLGYASAGIALLGAILWSLAFVNGVYGTEHSWVTASRWVYANLPEGSCIVGEHWEEGFPQTWDEPGMNPEAHRLRRAQPLPMYEEDTAQKFETLRDTLRNCDYLVLASNRLWRTIPRLPQRYPMSTRYYQLLFAGQLGFERVYEWATPPRLGPWVIDDQSADESFTVYDHPRPIIFKKTRQLSDAEWEALLGNTWQQAIHWYVGPPTLLMRLRGVTTTPGMQSTSSALPAATPRKSLLLDVPVDELPVVDDFRWNKWANASPVVAIVVWWLVVQLIGWLAWPVTRRLLGRLADQGYFLAKSFGWLLVGYGVWLGASLRVLPNTLPSVLVMLGLLACLAAWLTLRSLRRGETSWPQLSGGRLKLIALEEAVFGLAYLYFVGLRILNPDLWQPWNGGEKMLEIGFLNAIVKSAHMPPYDPYFAGGIINYYYYGMFLVGVLIKLTGIQPTIAFNLAVPTLGALSAGNAFCLAYNLAAGRASDAGNVSPAPAMLEQPASVADEGSPIASLPGSPGVQGRPVLIGLLAVLLVVFAGNLAGFTQLVHMLEAHGASTFQTDLPVVGEVVRSLAGIQHLIATGERLPAYNYWDPTRAIPETINEFPYFSFIFADLHPHMIGIPFTLLVLALIYAVCLRARACDPPPASAQWSEVPRLAWGGSLRRLLASWLDIARLKEVLRWLGLALAVGALGAINTWDLPTYLGLAALTFGLRRYRQRAGRASGIAGSLVLSGLEAVLFGALTLAASYLLYLPFFHHYQPLDVGLGVVSGQTDLGNFISIWGVFLFVAISYALVTLLHPQTRLAGLRLTSLFLRRWDVAPHLHAVYHRLAGPARHARWVIIGWLVLLALSVGLWLTGYRVPAVLLPLVCLAWVFLLRPEPADEPTFVGILLFTGLLLLLGVEIFYLRDFLGGSSYYRMNTLFKFYIQVWVMGGVAMAWLLAELWDRAASWRGSGLRVAWQSGAVLLIMASLVYPLLGTPTRVRDRFAQPPPIGTLDGMAYMTTGQLMWPEGNLIELRYDYEAIRWLQDNVVGTPVLAEAKIGYYREGGMRVASYTGLPMPLGGLHQNEQRWADQIAARDAQYMEFWNTHDPERAWQLIEQLDISYIYLGQLEQTLYNPGMTSTLMRWGVTFHAASGLPKFEALLSSGRLEIAYQNERTRIYRVKR